MLSISGKEYSETDESRMRDDMIKLVDIQRSIKTLQPLMAKKDDLSNTLSDVWNTLLDYRGYVIKNLFDNKHMQIAGLPYDIKIILDKKGIEFINKRRYHSNNKKFKKMCKTCNL